MHILILDSGVNYKHPRLQGENIEGYGLLYDEIQGSCRQVDDIDDEIGHGTAVYDLIRTGCPGASLKMVKVFWKEIEITEKALSMALSWLYEQENPDILNLSLGVTCCQEPKRLYDLCRKFRERGTIILSAFDNSGAVSYPAAFDCVYGVMGDAGIRRVQEVVFLKDSYVNILAKGTVSKLAWTQPEYVFFGSNSFACAMATATLARLLLEKKLSLDEIPLGKEVFSKARKLPFSIKKAVVFPFNKEIHALVRYAHLLSFTIKDIYDHRLSGRVGASTGKLLGDCQVADFVIKNMEQISWEDFDTLILGHLGELSALVGDFLLEERLIREALEKGKQIYALDSFSCTLVHKNLFSPRAISEDLSSNHFGKLYQINKPVLGVFGTSSKQGKFTLQLTLRDLLQKRGYRVGQLGTEPTALLFGMDEVFPYGYNAAIDLREEEALLYLNRQMQAIAETDCEIILVGAQSAVLSWDPANLEQYTPFQAVFLQGTMPDAVILTVSPQDPVTYIERTIQYLESAVDTQVLALCIFPVILEANVLGLYGKGRVLTKQEGQIHKQMLRKVLGKPVYLLGENDEMEEIVENVVDFF